MIHELEMKDEKRDWIDFVLESNPRMAELLALEVAKLKTPADIKLLDFEKDILLKRLRRLETVKQLCHNVVELYFDVYNHGCQFVKETLNFGCGLIERFDVIVTKMYVNPVTGRWLLSCKECNNDFLVKNDVVSYTKFPRLATWHTVDVFEYSPLPSYHIQLFGEPKNNVTPGPRLF